MPDLDQDGFEPDGFEPDAPAQAVDADGFEPDGFEPDSAPEAQLQTPDVAPVGPAKGFGEKLGDATISALEGAGTSSAFGAKNLRNSLVDYGQAAWNYGADVLDPKVDDSFSEHLDTAKATRQSIEGQAVAENPYANVAGGIAGAILPGKAISAGVGAVGTALAQAPKVSKLVQLAQQGVNALGKTGSFVSTAAGVGAVEGLAQQSVAEVDRAIVEGNWNGIAERLSTAAGWGAGLNVGGSAVAKGLSALVKKFKGINQATESLVEGGDDALRTSNGAERPLEPTAQAAYDYDPNRPLRAHQLVDESADPIKEIRRQTTHEVADAVENEVILSAEEKMQRALSLRNELEEEARKAAKKRYLSSEEFADQQQIPDEFLARLRNEATADSRVGATKAYERDVAELAENQAQLRKQHAKDLSDWDKEAAKVQKQWETDVKDWDKANAPSATSKNSGYSTLGVTPSKPRPVLDDYPLPPKPMLDEAELQTQIQYVPTADDRIATIPVKDAGTAYFNKIAADLGLSDEALKKLSKNAKGEGGAMVGQLLEKKHNIANGLRDSTDAPLTQGRFFDALDDFKSYVQKVTDKSQGGVEEFFNPRAEELRLILEGKSTKIPVPLHPKLMAEQAVVNQGWAGNIRTSKQGLLNGIYTAGKEAGADPFDVKKVITEGGLKKILRDDVTGQVEEAFKSDLRLSAKSLDQRLKTWNVAEAPDGSFPALMDKASSSKLDEYKKLIGDVEDDINRAKLARRYANQNAAQVPSITVGGTLSRSLKGAIESTPVIGGISKENASVYKAWGAEKQAQAAQAAFGMRDAAAKVQQRVNSATDITNRINKRVKAVEKPLKFEVIKRQLEDLQRLEDPTSEESGSRKGALLQIEKDAGPELATALQQQEDRKAQFLLSKIPNRPASAFSKGGRHFSEPALAQLSPYVEAVNDPLAALERVSDGTYSPEDKEVLTAVYPEMYQDWQQKTVLGLQNLKEEPDFDTQIRISMALGMPLAPSLNAQSMAFWQNFSAAQNQPEQDPGSDSYNIPSKGAATSGDLVNLAG